MLLPGHVLPPHAGSGSLHVRVRVMEPPVHELEHCPQDDQVDQLPSTTTKIWHIKEIFYIREVINLFYYILHKLSVQIRQIECFITQLGCYTTVYILLFSKNVSHIDFVTKRLTHLY